jgi:hypothetical protein
MAITSGTKAQRMRSLVGRSSGQLQITYETFVGKILWRWYQALWLLLLLLLLFTAIEFSAGGSSTYTSADKTM